MHDDTALDDHGTGFMSCADAMPCSHDHRSTAIQQGSGQDYTCESRIIRMNDRTSFVRAENNGSSMGYG